MKSKEILPDNFRIRPDLPSSEMVSSEYVYEYDKALKAAESEIQENGKEIKELKKESQEHTRIRKILDTRIETQRKWSDKESMIIFNQYRKLEKQKEQFEWIERNHPEVYKQIPK